MKQKIKAIHNVVTQDALSQSKEQLDQEKWDMASHQEIEVRNGNPI